MELLNPARITSLEPQVIRIIVHNNDRSTSDFSLDHVYPFESIFSLKQRIGQHFAEDKKWLPNQLFVAQDAGSGLYKTLEFYWPFGKLLKDPFVNAGIPDTRIYEDESRKPVFPTILSGAPLGSYVRNGLS